MALYLGGDSVDLKLGTKTLLLSAIYLHDLQDYYTKGETYKRDQVIDCLNGLLSSIQATYYSKAEISAIISAFEVPYTLEFIPEKSGSAQLKTSVTNVVSPSADMELVFPRTVVNSNQLGRDFFVQVYQPTPAVDLAFAGYGQEDLKFKTQDGQEIKEMEDGGHYLLYFSELCASTFMMRQMKLADLSTIQNEQEAVEESGLSTYWLVDNQVNYIDMTEDCRFVLPQMTCDVSGNMVTRDFMLYMKQGYLSAYDFEFLGREDESIKLVLKDGDAFGDTEAGCEYLFGFSEMKRNGLSSEFLAFQTKLADYSSEG